ncbi:MAG: hypothetical protein EPN22_00450 [Nitrospirae bacterium]|nr:MAG: hypothetical protein EPN22_00450 [Nitrospirota bacterium]
MPAEAYKTPGIVIATSIAPNNIGAQQAAVASWTDLGFRVVSLNIAEEIPRLAGHFPDVMFIRAARSAEYLAGRPLVFINELIDYLKGCGSKICGIVNSDIHFRADQGFAAFLMEQARDSLVFGARVDVDALDSAKGEFYVYGFDYFFFDISVLDCYPSEDFCIGAPWWDYWMLSTPILQGKLLKELVSPIAFHVKHEFNYSPDHWYGFAKKLLKHVNKELYDAIAPLQAANEHPLYSAINYVGSAGLKFIIEHSSKIKYEKPGINLSMENFKCREHYKTVAFPYYDGKDQAEEAKGNGDDNETGPAAGDLLKRKSYYKNACKLFLDICKEDWDSIILSFNETAKYDQAEKLFFIRCMGYLISKKDYTTAMRLLERYPEKDEIGIQLRNALMTVISN